MPTRTVIQQHEDWHAGIRYVWYSERRWAMSLYQYDGCAVRLIFIASKSPRLSLKSFQRWSYSVFITCNCCSDYSTFNQLQPWRSHISKLMMSLIQQEPISSAVVAATVACNSCNFDRTVYLACKRCDRFYFVTWLLCLARGVGPVMCGPPTSFTSSASSPPTSWLHQPVSVTIKLDSLSVCQSICRSFLISNVNHCSSFDA